MLLIKQNFKKYATGMALCGAYVLMMLLYKPASTNAQDLTNTPVQDITPLDNTNIQDVDDTNAPEIENLNDPVIVPTDEMGNLELPVLPEGAEDENLFFDAEALVPTGEMGRKGGPRKVNPRLEPGSKFVIVEQNYSKGSTHAQLVSADRAMKLGRYNSALKMYERLEEKRPRDPNVILGLATAYQQTGRIEEAIRKYESLLVIKPNNTHAQINRLGLVGQRYPSVALRQLLDLYDQDPHNVGLAAQIAVMQAKLARYDEAIQYLGMAASMEPSNASHVYNMAVIADRTGDKLEAVKYYEQALEIDVTYGGSKSIPREAIYERLANIR